MLFLLLFPGLPIKLFGLFPGEIWVISAEVTVVGSLFVDGSLEVQLSDHHSWT